MPAAAGLVGLLEGGQQEHHGLEALAEHGEEGHGDHGPIAEPGGQRAVGLALGDRP